MLTAGVVLALTGCSQQPKTIDDVLGTPSPTAKSTPSPTSAPSATTAAFPRTCAELVPPGAIAAAIGARPLPGSVSFVYAGPVRSSGRLERTTCGYGVTVGKDGKPDVVRMEVSLVRYRQAADADARVALTVQTAAGGGDHVYPFTLHGRRGYLLSDRTGSSYVLADGARTLVVSIRAGVVPAPAVKVALIGLAQRVLRLGASPSP